MIAATVRAVVDLLSCKPQCGNNTATQTDTQHIRMAKAMHSTENCGGTATLVAECLAHAKRRWRREWGTFSKHVEIG